MIFAPTSPSRAEQDSAHPVIPSVELKTTERGIVVPTNVVFHLGELMIEQGFNTPPDTIEEPTLIASARQVEQYPNSDEQESAA